MYVRAVILAAALALCGCKVGPNYKRPPVPAPPQFRWGESNPSNASLGNEKWFDLFQDDTLRGLIRQALLTNYDLRMAAQRVVSAQGQLQATRSLLFPHLDGQIAGSRTAVQVPLQSTLGAFGAVSWEPDFFGKFRRATEAARADLLSTRDNQYAVVQTLVAQVASAYFDLLEIDAELKIVRESIKTRQASVDLVSARVEGGVGNLLDLDQAKSLVESAQSDAISLERAQAQIEDLINYLLGNPPANVLRGRILTDQPLPPDVPAGLPSALLQRRPDILSAEQQLVAANARVGIARAAFFPSINMTAAGGVATADFSGLNQRGFAYDMLGLFSVPIFDAGRRSGNYKTAKGQREELLLNYLNVINGSFRDVSDALIGYRKAREFVANQAVLAETLRDQTRLANSRYVGGVSSYLEVLDTERQRLTAEQALLRARRDVLIALVQLYKALGGGWQ
jgi:multidrug efflux system outer membrane protein